MAPGVGALNTLPATRAVRSERSRSSSAVWLIVLAVAGVAIGAGGGYLVVSRRHLLTGAAGGPVATRPGPPSDGQPSAGPGGEGASAAMVPGGACPAGMQLVSGGAFKMGTAADDKLQFMDERPLQSVQVASFCVDEYEYPNKVGAMPRVGVSWLEAKAQCEGAGKRLCTEEEWEKACKGPGSARFPYGSAFDANKCDTEDGSGMDRALATSGTFPDCRSGYRVADLSGNAAEWTSTPYGENGNIALKGGAFDAPDYAVKCSSRKNGVPTEKSDTVGFRCCAGVLP
jgi:formylglycine-generating enzyme required for sulfatase activity